MFISKTQFAHSLNKLTDYEADKRVSYQKPNVKLRG